MKKPAAFAAVATTILAAGIAAVASRSPGYVVHEWGTFTTVAGLDGEALTWRPFSTPDVLPRFVETSWRCEKGGISAKVRMETPVLYFYSDHDLDASVRVRFPGGAMTEWFPAANVDEGEAIEWPRVRVRPDDREPFPFAEEGGGEHYYRARATDAAPLVVPREDGDQREKFLFYRGAGNFEPPLRARLDVASGTVVVENACDEPIAGLVVFERAGDRVGFSDPATLAPGATSSIARPSVDRDVEGLFDALRSSLVAAGLFEREARAMVETWRDDWFEEGLRCFYLVPRAITDGVLPIAIEPAPEALERVLVGRIEIVRPAEVRALRDLDERLRSPDSQVCGAAWQELGSGRARFADPVLRALRRGVDNARLAARIDAYAGDGR